MNRKLLLLLPLLFLSTFSLAEEPATKPAATVIKASDKAALDANKDKTVTVEGSVTDAAWSKSGKVMIIKFADADDSGFSAVVFDRAKTAFNKAFDGDAAQSLTGAKVKVTGKLGSYHDQPQIILNKPSQITIDKDKPAESK